MGTCVSCKIALAETFKIITYVPDILYVLFSLIVVFQKQIPLHEFEINESYFNFIRINFLSI